MKLNHMITIVLFSISFHLSVLAQVGIGTTTPDASAMLEIKSTNSGLLIPRLSLSERNNITNPATGLLIFQIGAENTFYFYDGATWVPLINANFWKTVGNANTDVTSNLLGTSDNEDFIVKANNIEVFRITASGSIAIGAQTAQNLVHLESTTSPALRLNDGNQTEGSVLTSDMQGNATWIDPEDFANISDGDWSYVNQNQNTDPLARTGRVLIGRNPIVTGRNARALLDVQLDTEISGSSIGLGSTEFYTDLGSEFTFSNDLVPIVDNSIPIGNATNRWNEVFATNGTINTSDLRDKKEIQEIKYGIKELLKLKPVSYQWNSKAKTRNLTSLDNSKKIGFLAQELQKILPEVVQEYYWIRDKNGTYKKNKKEFAISYSEILPVIVKAIQEHQEIIEQLKEQEVVIRKLLEE
ncbi:tail fiber domain-containing protein [uncultured Dokdonia sp.]|uniref:tail fiber domain-containing protein n=1 Tax=uncultured Dokdonia sp. TaxID=575653 RepID=UPI002605D935|nr:tail fiber domain-containing protein [uncultured Dokdonia sp.]